MTTRILFVLFLVAGVLGGSVAYAQNGIGLYGGPNRIIVDSELVAIAGACYVRDTMSDGSIREIPCDELEYYDLEDYSDNEWDDFCDRYGPYLTPAQYEEYCGGIVNGYMIRVSDRIAFSGIGVHLDTGYVMTSPFRRGFLATEVLGTLVNPAFDVPYSMSGYRLGFGLDADLSVDKFSPFRISAGVEYGKLTGTGTASNIMLDNFGVTSVGVTPGVFVNWPTDVLGASFTVDRSFASLGTKVSVPLFRGEYSFAGTGLGSTISELDYDVYAVAGKRLGYLTQAEQTLIDTSTPAFGINNLSQIRYDTRFDGMFAGAQLGLGLDKRIPFADSDLAIEETFALLFGYDFYRFRVTDSVNASGLGGALNHVSTNTFDVSASVPTLQFMGSVGLGNGKWYAGLKGGVSAGLYPEFNYNRPDSVAPATPLQPTLQLLPGWSYELSADFRLRF